MFPTVVTQYLFPLLFLPIFQTPHPTTALTLPLPHNHTTTPTPNSLTFRLTMATAVRRVQHMHPSARPHRIECTTSHGTPTLLAHELTDIRLWFSLPAPNPDDDPSTILLLSRSDASAWGQWDLPRYIPQPLPPSELGIGDILTSDIAQVLEAMREAGQERRFRAVDVVREVGMQEVMWNWQMSGSGSKWVWVGDESLMVEPEDGGGVGED
ncbi:MAG: hypothetical protein HETSPECPRED_000548 [Heterodermia speciosa]|uniref:Uncharacterized protein n=1 Tax=Heterodermia speciosa TaxID=116794 RepID=A0A8H3IXW8_9LECA|nr:MAG: hypothetical protein HETSPECPRED_000548 [Heterodermia speciosa]